MSIDSLRRQSALKALNEIKKAGDDVSSILREQVQALSRVSTKMILSHFKEAKPHRLTLRGGHKMEFTCVTHSDVAIYLGSGDGTVSAWTLSSGSFESSEAKGEKPMSQLFLIKGKPKIRVHGRKQSFQYDVMGIKLNRHPYASIHSTSRVRDAYSEGHYGGITALAASADGAYLASAGLDCLVNIRNGRTGKSLFSLILDNIALSMTIFGHTLTVCMQSSLRVFNLDDHCEMFVLRGHEYHITGCASLGEEKSAVVTCSLDKSVRLFDYDKQTQLIFPSGTVLECVCWPSNDIFIAGCPHGLVIHTREKKNPIMQVHPHDSLKFVSGDTAAHKFVPETNYCRRMVTALDCLANGDIVVSGCHGLVSIWKYSSSSLEKVVDYPVPGFVNALKIVIKHSKVYLVVALGKVPARGRWDSDAFGYNGVLILDINCSVPTEVQGSSRFKVRAANS